MKKKIQKLHRLNRLKDCRKVKANLKKIILITSTESMQDDFLFRKINLSQLDRCYHVLRFSRHSLS